jgi:hypothetical protein
MTHLIELGSNTANHRTFHFRLFTSNGTSPDTGASNDSVIVARASTTTFVPDVLVTAVHAAQGMYSVQLTQSNVSNLGQHAIYHTQGDFPQHVANFNVVNFNPYSNWSNAAAIVHSGVTFGSAATVVTGGIVAASFAAGAIDATAIAADAIGSSELAQSAAQEIADEVLNRDIAGSASGSSRNVRNALRFLRNRVDARSSTLTVYQEDDSTAAWTASVTTTTDPSNINHIDP